LQECGSVSDLKFTNESKSTAYAKILFDPAEAQDLPKLEDSLQAKYSGSFKMAAKELQDKSLKSAFEDKEP